MLMQTRYRFFGSKNSTIYYNYIGLILILLKTLIPAPLHLFILRDPKLYLEFIQ
jgi:hypothetical protein